MRESIQCMEENKQWDRGHSPRGREDQRSDEVIVTENGHVSILNQTM